MYHITICMLLLYPIQYLFIISNQKKMEIEKNNSDKVLIYKPGIKIKNNQGSKSINLTQIKPNIELMPMPQNKKPPIKVVSRSKTVMGSQNNKQGWLDMSGSLQKQRRQNNLYLSSKNLEINKIQEEFNKPNIQWINIESRYQNKFCKANSQKPIIRAPFKAQFIKPDENTVIMAKSEIHCPVCAQKIYQSKIISIDKCKHSLHLQCVLPYIQMKISEATLEIRCPWTNCDSILSQNFLRSILSQQDLGKYYRFSAYMYIEKHKKNEWVQCTQPECNEIFFKKYTQGYLWYICNKSKFKICIKCNKNYHPKFKDCNDYIKSLDPNSGEFKLMEMMEKNGWKQCPKCKQFVQKNQGCNHITCKCKNQFCYACEGPYPNCYCLKNARV